MVEKGYLVRGKRGSGTYVKQTHVFPAGHLAIIVPSPLDYFYTKIIDGAQNTALARGYLMSVVSPPASELERYLNALGISDILGIIAIGMIVRLPIPAVTVDYDYAAELPGGNLVNTDNLAGGHAMMREVIARGHREIAIYSTIRINLDRQRRVRGFVAEMEKVKITRLRERIYYGAQWSAADAEKNLLQMLRDFPKLSIIACDSDDAVSILLDAAKKLKIDLPGHIAITGFGNVIGNYGGVLNIANVEQFPVRLGASACDHLIRRIESGKEMDPVRDFFPPELIHPEYIPTLTVK